MQNTHLSIAKLLPHRDRMRLIDSIVRVDDNSAVTCALVTSSWPMADASGVDALLLIELVAQTAGVFIAHKTYCRTGNAPDGSGWLVGIKKAHFNCDRIPLKARITTHVHPLKSIENYTLIDGEGHIGKKRVCRVGLQVLHTNVPYEQS